MEKRLHDIDPDTLREWLEQEKVCLIDVREPYEYALERIEGATLIPTSTFTAEQLPKGEARPFLFYCKAGVRSANCAKKFLASADGVSESYHLEGGIDFWRESGMPTEKKKSAVISIERQFQLLLGLFLSLFVLLTAFVHPGFLWAVAFIGAGLLFAGATGICALTIFLSKLPHNQR